MDQIKKYLKVKPRDEVWYKPEQYVYLTTMDGLKQAYLLKLKHVKSFLHVYATQMIKGINLHLNVQLTALDDHALCIDVDYQETAEMPGPLSGQRAVDGLRLYLEIVNEINLQMNLEGDDISEREPHLFYAFFLTRVGSSNFHMIFPFLYLNRMDYAMLLSRVGQWIDKVDVVTGWLMHGSCKKAGLSSYQVEGLFTLDQTAMMIGAELSNLMQGLYNGKSLPYIYSHLLFPARFPEFKSVRRLFYPIRKSRNPNLPHAEMILQHTYSPVETCYYRVLKSELPTEDSLPMTQDLYTWCSYNKNNFTFTFLHKELRSFMEKFYPPLFNRNASDQLLASTMTEDQLDPKARTIFMHFKNFFTVDQFDKLLDTYNEDYRMELEDILNNSTKQSPYTIKSILYELSFRYGDKLIRNTPIYVSQNHMHEVKTQFLNKRSEVFISEVISLMRYIPYVRQNLNIRIFNWDRRDWTTSMTLTEFAFLLTSALIDTILLHLPDEDLKREYRGKRKGYFGEYKLLEMSMRCEPDTIEFDTNPWLLGMHNDQVINLNNGMPRLAIPQDYVLKKMKYSFDYINPELSHIFLNRDQYMEAFHSLQEHLTTQPIETFVKTGCPPIDHLLAFFILIFCEEFDEMKFFISYLATSLIGRNFQRMILFLIGRTSNGKTTLARLSKLVFGEYGGILKPSQFYANSTKFESGESAQPELASKVGCRLVVVEELSPRHELNVPLLNSLAGNNQLSVRDLYCSGKEVDISFNLLFTMNNYPIVNVTPALKQRLKILRCNSSFLPTATTYDFRTRTFPQQPDLDLEILGSPFTSLLIQVLQELRKSPMVTPASMTENLDHLAVLESALTKFENQYIMETNNPDDFISSLDILTYLRLYQKQRANRLDESCEDLMARFETKHAHRLILKTPTRDEGYVGMILNLSKRK